MDRTPWAAVDTLLYIASLYIVYATGISIDKARQGPAIANSGSFAFQRMRNRRRHS